MATAMQAMKDSAARHVGSGAVATPVIADRGDTAFVVVVNTDGKLQLGDRFEFAGAIWEVTRTGDRLRGCVANPVARG